MKKYSIPLISGVLTALIWVNIDRDSYHHATRTPLMGRAPWLQHEISLHFIVKYSLQNGLKWSEKLIFHVNRAQDSLNYTPVYSGRHGINILDLKWFISTFSCGQSRFRHIALIKFHRDEDFWVKMSILGWRMRGMVSFVPNG